MGLETDGDIRGRRLRVAMMVQNNVEFDTRVRKEAESLAGAGYDVRVLGRTAAHLPDVEEVAGVTYERVPLNRGLNRMMTALKRPRLDVSRRAEWDRGSRGALALIAVTLRLRAEVDLGLVRLIRWVDSTICGFRADHGRAIYLLAPLVVVRKAAVVGRLTLAKTVRPLRIASVRVRRRWRLKRPRLVLGHHWFNRLMRRFDRRIRRAIAPLALHVDWAASVAPRLEHFAPDVVHAHDLNTLLAGWRHKRRHGCRLIYDAHELELHRNQEWTRYKRILARSIELIGIRSSDGVITVSPLIAADLARTYRVRPPVVILNSPLLQTRHLDPALDLRALAGLAREERLTVYVGGVLYRRGHEQLVEALVHLPERHHVGVLGPRKPKNEAPLLELATALGVGDRLHFFGAVPAPQVPATLAGADATIIPIPNVCRSYDFALPNKLFDAVMAGIPIGVSRLRHMRDFVIQHELGLVVDETDPRSIAKGLERLTEGSKPGENDAGRLERLQAAVAWDAQEGVLLALYRRVLG